MTQTPTTLRTSFFAYLFGEEEGFICICTSEAGEDKNKSFRQHFFNWPTQKKELESFVEQVSHRKNVWFCTSLLDRSERKKENCLPGQLVWADLDTCDPELLDPKPSIVIQSSPGRWQALWRTDEVMEPVVASELSKRIAYKYAGHGADKSGWDLTQLLRVPYTFNYKYERENIDVPRVEILDIADTRVPFVLLKALPEAEVAPQEHALNGDAPWIDMPDVLNLPEADKVIYRYSPALSSTPFMVLYDTSPDEGADWSATMWRLLHICLEAGMSNEEAFAVAIGAKCNKYTRDNRPQDNLWKEVLKVEVAHHRLSIITGQRLALPMPELVTEAEVDKLKPTFIDHYKAWATEATDAVPQYHELSAFIMLSAVLAGGLKLFTTYAPTGMQPNLWGLILGDSTLARKTTAMRMAMDFVADVDSEIILATDGSAEGLITGLAGRPNRTSIFYKDEVSGFIDSINRKDYLAGMPEILTQLYDVPRIYSRRLRKETITLQSPVFIFFGGGIRDKVYQLVSEEYVTSGFLPRFLVVSGDADLTKIRRTGPINATGTSQRDSLIHTIVQLHATYNTEAVLKIGPTETTIPRVNEAVLTDEAWNRYGDMEELMVHTAYESAIPMLALPTFERLSRSLLKMSVLLAAARQSPKENKIKVELRDVIGAAKYVQDWGRYSVDLIQNAGKGVSERALEKLINTIKKVPDITRGELMQRHHLSKREADDMLNTLVERGNVIANKSGRGVRLRAV